LNLAQLGYDLNYYDLYEKVKDYKNGNGSTVIFDDTMTDLNKEYVKMFTTLGHHTNSNLMLMSQNLFHNNNTFRSISLNMHYISLLKNKRDLKQIGYISGQICPNNPVYVAQSYEDATINPYSYLFIDFHPKSPDKLQCRSNIFSFIPKYYEEYKPYVVYLKR